VRQRAAPSCAVDRDRRSRPGPLLVAERCVVAGRGDVGDHVLWCATVRETRQPTDHRSGACVSSLTVFEGTLPCLAILSDVHDYEPLVKAPSLSMEHSVSLLMLAAAHGWPLELSG
jgi:hypothetical protein